MDFTLSNFLLMIVLVVVMLLGITAVIIFLVVRRLQRFTSPDILELQKQFMELQTANPNAVKEEHLRKIIQRQSFKCGMVGAIAGLGGFVTLPIALPVDMLLSMQIQSTLVQFIAAAYEQSPVSNETRKLQTYLITAGSVNISETTFRLIMKFVLRCLGESLSLLIPVIGGISGFVVNYAIARATAQTALLWYSRKPSKLSS